jgi:hypothetical protein
MTSLGMSLGRRRGRRIALLGSLLLLGAAVAGIVAPSSHARAATTVQVYLTSAPTYCVNVTGNDHVAGAKLNLWKCATGGSSSWNLITGLLCIEKSGTNCFELQDTHNTKLCIAAPIDSYDFLRLQTCGGNDSITTWYSEGDGHIGSGAYGAGHTMASDGAVNGSFLEAVIAPPVAGYWWTWTIS